MLTISFLGLIALHFCAATQNAELAHQTHPDALSHDDSLHNEGASLLVHADGSITPATAAGNAPATLNGTPAKAADGFPTTTDKMPRAAKVLDCGETVIEYEGGLPQADGSIALAGAGSLQSYPREHFDETFKHPEYASNTIRKAIMKAPVHTCTIKYYPGLKSFLRDHPGIPGFEVQAYAQPPNVQLFGNTGELMLHVTLAYETTEEDLVSFFQYHGFTVPGTVGTEPALNVI